MDSKELCLELYRLEFEKSKNPLHVIGAFVFAHDAGMTPPGWVLHFIAEVFTKYAQANGALSLDKLFGFKRGNGQSPAIKNGVDQLQDTMAMLDICTLKTLFGLTTDQAAQMVGNCPERYEMGDKPIAYPETLADKYSRRSWQEKFKTDPYLSFLLTLNTNVDKQQYLSSFPRGCWPDKLKRQYK